jgi:hypothetical protein
LKWFLQCQKHAIKLFVGCCFKNKSEIRHQLHLAILRQVDKIRKFCMSITAAYYNDNIFLKHRKKRSSGGSTVTSADDGCCMSTGICHSNKIRKFCMSITAAYYNDNIFLKHRKKRSSGGSTVTSADDGRCMSTGICHSNGRYLIRAPSSGIYETKNPH